MEAHRPNPTFLAIARLALDDHDFKAMALERLAAQYPELDFVFNKLVDLGDDANDRADAEQQKAWDDDDEIAQLKASMTESRELIQRVTGRLKDDNEDNRHMMTIVELEVAATWLNVS